MRGRTKTLRPLGLVAVRGCGRARLRFAGACEDTLPTPPKPSTPAGPLTPPGVTVSVQGVVQSVSPSTVLVKQLDGSAVIVPVDKTTQFFVNGKPAGSATSSAASC